MGGPLWARRDRGAWSIVKGECEDGEDGLAAARREFVEETGCPVPAGEPVALGEVRQRSGKVVGAWALEADLDADAIEPGTFTMEWPPRSGRMQQFQEIDRVVWLDLETAAEKLVPAQVAFLERLEKLLAGA
jgi:predicted NUDIX family NTP pyrophosphohydrolase